MPKNPDQGTLLLPGISDREIVPPEGREYTVYRQASVEPIAQPVEPVNIVERNTQVRRLLGILGVVAETAPAVRIDEDETVREAFKARFGEEEYEAEAERQAGVNAKMQAKFEDAFKLMWRYDEVKKSGVFTEEDLEKKYKQDKDHFLGRFSENPGVSVHRAALNRRNYRYRLNRQRKAYRASNVGIWPKQRSRSSTRPKAA